MTKVEALVVERGIEKVREYFQGGINGRGIDVISLFGILLNDQFFHFFPNFDLN